MTRKSILIVKRVETADYGKYICKAKNSHGETATVIFLQPKSVPDTPINLRVVSKLHNAVHLTWNLGFSGGYEQYVRIKYRPSFERVGRNNWLYSEIVKYNMTEIILESLNINTEYKFKAGAYNKLGESDFTEAIRVSTESKHSLAFKSDNLIGRLKDLRNNCFVKKMSLQFFLR